MFGIYQHLIHVYYRNKLSLDIFERSTEVLIMLILLKIKC